jgi:ubiquinol-cytochrome c reductase subunit 7
VPYTARRYSSGWPSKTGSISETQNWGYLCSSINEYPGWYQKILRWCNSSGFTERYINWMGYRRYGFKFEDILIETPPLQEALFRLPGEVLSDRDDRIKEALCASASGDILPKEKHLTKENDTPDRNHFRPK